MKRYWVSILLLLLHSACSQVDSEDIKSSGFHAEMDLTAVGNNRTQAKVCLTTGSNSLADKIILSNGDHLVASANGMSQRLEQDAYCYINSFDFDEGGTEFLIALERDLEESMPNSHVALPPRFNVSAPDNDSTFNAGDSITLAWAPSIDSGYMGVVYKGTCSSSIDAREKSFKRSYTIADVGTHSIQINDLLNVHNEHSLFDRSEACPATIEIKRTINGQLDPNYGQGGEIKAHQIRRISIQINP